VGKEVGANAVEVTPEKVAMIISSGILSARKQLGRKHDGWEGAGEVAEKSYENPYL